MNFKKIGEIYSIIYIYHDLAAFSIYLGSQVFPRHKKMNFKNFIKSFLLLDRQCF